MGEGSVPNCGVAIGSGQVRYRFARTMSYRLICLDAGFTLLSPRRTLADSLRDVLREHGADPSDEEIQAAWQAANAWFLEEYHRPDNRTWTRDDAIEETWRRYHDLMLRQLGVSGRRELIERILAAQASPDTWELYPDVVPTLRRLRDGGVNGSGARPLIGVISDWGSNLAHLLAGVGASPYLDFVLASGSAGYAKPDPDFFRLATSRAGVDPSQAVMIGDSYLADVVGARSAGMEGILLRRTDGGGGGPVAAPPEAPDVPVIASLAELPELLERATPLAG